MSEEINPYAAPLSQNLTAATPADELPLAGRWRRLGASIIDMVIMVVIVLPLAFIYALLFVDGVDITNFYSVQSEISEYGWAVIAFFILVGANWIYLLRGQTIGKSLLGIRVDDLNGGPCERSRNVLKRMAPIHLLALIPGVGEIISLIDCLMIFRSDKRTLHDLIAGTKVVDIRQLAA